MSADVLDTAAMLAGAEAETGLHDYGDETLPARFALAAEHLRSVGLNEDGRKAAAAVCHWLLTSRLEFFADRKRHPVGDEEIEAPLFATGEPRSGTTLLHALMSVDPHARALRFWEVMYPSPPPGLAGADDARRALADEDWRDILKRLPKWLISHPYNDMLGDGLPECERSWAFDFRVMTPTAWWRVPMGMNVGGLPADGDAQMRLHKMMLQQCQFGRPKRYWVLKGFHGPRLAELFDTYPDAHLIWVHRDPVQVIASRIALVGELIEGLAGCVDWKEQSKIHLEASRAGFASTMANPLVRDPRIYHVRYTDFVADPVGTIRGFYRYAGKAFPPGTEAAMREYLQQNRGDRYGKFKYSTDLIDADIDQLNKEFAPFRERFGLEIETRK